MSNAPKDGGPAFPFVGKIHHISYEEEFRQEGMSLRDWFAGHALQAIIGNIGDENVLTFGAAEIRLKAAVASYLFAEAMIAERNRRNEPTS